MSRTSEAHKKGAPKTLTYAIITVSTSKYRQRKTQGEEGGVEDASGDTIERLLRGAGQGVGLRGLVPDEPKMIKAAINEALAKGNIDVVITTGGTGITQTDQTIETVGGMLDKEIPGFGEIFRRISYDKIGSAAVLSRATAGVKEGKGIFCLPGSPDAVETAVRNVIIPEAPHIVRHAREL